MDWRQYLEKDEDRAHERERCTQGIAALNRAHQDAHGDRERRGQHTAQDENGPPRERQGAVSLQEGGEELPLISLTQGSHVKGSTRFFGVLQEPGRTLVKPSR